MKSKEYIVEGRTTAYKVRFAVYNKGSLNGKIMVALCKLGPLFWDCSEHDLFLQPEVAEARFKELCKKADELAKEGST